MKIHAVLSKLLVLVVVGVVPVLVCPSVCVADLHGTDGMLRLSSARTLPEGGWSLGLFGHYYQRMSPYAHSVEENYAVGNLSGRYGFTEWFETFAVLPGKGSLWKYKPLPDREEFDEDHGGVGDLSVGLKMKLPLESDVYALAVMAEASFPTGKDMEYVMPGTDVAQRLFSSACVNLSGRLCASFNLSQVQALSPLQIHLNLGYWLNRETETVRFPSYILPIPGRLEDKDVIIAGLGLEFPSPVVTLFTELYTEQFVNGSDVAKSKENPILLSPGAKIRLPFGFVSTVAADIKLSGNAAETTFNPDDELPDWALTIGFDFFPTVFKNDMDGDGVMDNRDLCPAEREDVDGFQDEDGCPDLDNDGDKIPDTTDRCPNEAETFNGYADEDGCPEGDADRDGVADVSDKCPVEREDVDGFQDEDGCPDLDNDGDSIPDANDRCPNEAETFNGYADEDGCPDQTPEVEEVEIDTDGDGIPNSKDKCPSLAEDVDGFQDADGCPDIDNDSDGIVDPEDRCPNSPEDQDGDRDEDGCPDR